MRMRSFRVVSYAQDSFTKIQKLVSRRPMNGNKKKRKKTNVQEQY